MSSPAVYCTIGGLWADALTELGQFIIQLFAGLAMLFAVMSELDGFSTLWTRLGRAGARRATRTPTAGPYTVTFLLAFLFIKTFEYNGGMWNQAQRYMATGNAREATRSARLSAILWLVWPLVLFFPMWCAPLLIDAKKPDASDSYALMTEQLLPHGLLGLVIVGLLLAHHGHVLLRRQRHRRRLHPGHRAGAVARRRGAGANGAGLLAARLSTIAFLALSMAIATQVNSPTFKDIITVVIKWVAGLMGPIAIPFMLGLLRRFRQVRSDRGAGQLGGGTDRVLLPQLPDRRHARTDVALQYQVSVPLAISLVLYILIGFLKPEDTPERDAVIARINTDDDGPDAGVAAVVPGQAEPGPGEPAKVLGREGSEG